VYELGANDFLIKPIDPKTAFFRIQNLLKSKHRISIETIADRLTQLMKAENISVEDRAIKYVAKAADGSMRDALSLLDQCIAFYLGKELKYENVLDVLGAVDTEVFSKMYKTIKTSDVAGCMNLMEDIIMQGRDLSQFVTDFTIISRLLPSSVTVTSACFNKFISSASSIEATI
jgi:DNA polymerase III gamma/tau subunit